ncbi:hypothetical protein ACJX0J_008339, partial [Zea mays]
ERNLWSMVTKYAALNIAVNLNPVICATTTAQKDKTLGVNIIHNKNYVIFILLFCNNNKFIKQINIAVESQLAVKQQDFGVKPIYAYYTLNQFFGVIMVFFVFVLQI